MELEIRNNEVDYRFECYVDGLLSEVVYTKINENEVLITGTHVPKELEGRGIAAALTQFALEYAREHKWVVTPICSYTVAYFKRHPEYNDILKSASEE